MRTTLTVLLVLASELQAGTSWIELIPDTPGPYDPGASVSVDVLFHNREGEGFSPRLMTLDFSATDPSLSLPALFQFRFDPPVAEYLYTQFEMMPKVDIVLSAFPENPLLYIHVQDGDSYLLGTFVVGMPDHPGIYVLDAMNRDALDTDTGARIDYGFDERVILHWLNGNLTGGQLVMTVVPEPGMLTLLAFGALALAALRQPLRRIRT